MVGGYVSGDRALLIVLNTSSKKRSFDLELGLMPFIASNSGKYRAVLYDGAGEKVSQAVVSGADRLATPPMNHLDLVLWELALP